MLGFSGLSYAYPDARAPALDGVELSLGSGLALLTGASGSGKSTLLRVCNGLVPHFHGGVIAGQATVVGRDVLTTPTRELARDVGFLFQDPELQAVYASVERDVAFGLENLGIPSREMGRRVDEALQSCGVAHLRGRAVSTLSGGERQRVALAGVLAMRPRLLVLDEPISQLDPAGAEALVAALDGAIAQGTAVLVAEHRDELAFRHSGRALQIEAGRLTEGVPHSGPAPTSPRVTVRRGRGPAPTEAGWQLSRVTAGYGATPVLHDLELSGGAGEVLVLSGPNGSGKSTLLRTIAGLLPPLAGAVRRAPGRVAYLPQNPGALLHRSTVRAEVEWTLRRAGGAASPDEVLRSFGLCSVAGRCPRDLSSGERQRAALAAVLAGSPSLALLDEPTRGMDEPSRSALVEAVAGLAEAGAGVVLATNDRRLAGEIATRVVQVGEGTAREAFSPPEAAEPC